ncbi:hypothetical protein PTKIN_Ptkin05aG0069100 [Pterospermum kingtungense]
MGTNYVILMGLFLLLIAVDCSSSERKGNVNENTGLDHSVDGTVDLIKQKVDTKSVSDSTGVSKVKDNGDKIKGSEGGIDSNASKSNLNQQSGSDDGENLRKDGKESSDEAKENTDGGKQGDSVHKGQEDSNVEAKVKTGGEREGDYVQKGQEKPNVEAKGKMESEKEGNKVQKGQEDSNIEAKVKTGGEREGDNVPKGPKKPNVEAKGKIESEKEGNIVQKGQEESNVEAKVETGGEREGNNVQKDREELNVEAKVETGGDRQGNNVQKGQEEPNVEAEEKKEGEREGDNAHKSREESNVEGKGKTEVEKEGNNVQKGQEESNVGAKGKKDDEREGDNVHNGQEGSNVDVEGKKDVEKEGNNVQKSQVESNVGAKGKTDIENEGDSVHKGQEESNLEEGKTDSEKNKNPDDNMDPKEVTKEEDDIHDSVQPPPPPLPKRSDGFQSEGCDPSYMCMDKNKRFVACLRVPGNESPDLSLLIQNKGKGPLTLKISAPAFVQLEKKDIDLPEEGRKEVKVTIENSGTENLIVLKDGTGECSLDFKDLIVHNSAKSYVNFLSQTPTTTFIFVAAILILASGWMCMSLRRRQLRRRGLKYQRVDMKLPVSVGPKTEPDVNDGWDNSWGDDWDDEEAPMTPSKPVTPSVSSKGLASRRLSKEAWKD